MLHFSDAPYTFRPPCPNRLVMWIGRQINRRLALPGRRHRIVGVRVVDDDRIREVRRADPKARLLFLPNHSTHSDPEIMTEVQRQLETPSCFMAAYDVFERHPVQAWVMQRCGAFSVDRDTTDGQAMKTAIRLLVEGDFALTIFPEGNVHFTNDRVAEFLEGAAFIAMKARRELAEAGTILAVPVSIKATHVEDARPAVRELLDRVAAALGTAFDPDADPVAEVVRIGIEALVRNLRNRGFALPDARGRPVREVLAESVETIVTGLETKMEVSPKPGAVLKDRARRLRSQVHQVRLDPARRADHDAAAVWADEAMLALRILSYRGDYLAENPSLDRVAETAEKLAEDAFSEAPDPTGPREAIVRINEPIDLGDHLEGFAKRARDAVRDLTERFSASVQEGLDAINRTNDHAGSEPFVAAEPPRADRVKPGRGGSR